MNARADEPSAFPWGDTPESAIRWSFNKLVASSQPNSSMASMTKVDSGSRGGNWSQMDALAQASLLRTAIARIAEPELKAYVEAHYLPSAVREGVPGGGGAIFDRFGVLRGKAIQSVAYYLMQQSERNATSMPRVGFEELVSQYVLGKPNNDALCRTMKLRRERANTTRAMWYEKLDELHARAMQATAAQLRKVGLL
jgi:hypothetical protein